MHNGIITLTLRQLTVRKTNNVHTQLGHFHAMVGHVSGGESYAWSFEVQDKDYEIGEEPSIRFS